MKSHVKSIDMGTRFIECGNVGVQVEFGEKGVAGLLDLD